MGFLDRGQVRQEITGTVFCKAVQNGFHSTEWYVERQRALAGVYGNWLVAGRMGQAMHQRSIRDSNDKPYLHDPAPEDTTGVLPSAFICSAVSRINATARQVRSNTRTQASVTLIASFSA